MGLTARRRRRTGPRGRGEIRLLKSGGANVYIQHNKNEDPVQYPILPEDMSEQVLEMMGDKRQLRDAYISLDESEAEIRFAGPWEGQFGMRFVDVVRTDEDNVPLLVTKQGKTGVQRRDGKGKFDIPTIKQFICNLEILSAEDPKQEVFVGLRPSLRVPFLFERNKAGELEIVYEFKPHYDELWSAMTVMGFDPDAHTLLPGEPGGIVAQLEEIWQEKDFDFIGTYEKGWINELGEAKVGLQARRK